MWHHEPNVRSDCLKVLYEIGYLKPELVAPYAGDFLKLLGSRNNRLVWGAMIGLSTVAEIAADEIYPHAAEIQRAMAGGTIITLDAGVLALARLAATGDDRRTALLPYLFDFLQDCRPSDLPRHAERVLMAVGTDSKDEFVAVLQARMPLLTTAQATGSRRSCGRRRCAERGDAMAAGIAGPPILRPLRPTYAACYNSRQTQQG